MEPYEKIYVKKDFLETEHGQIPCQDCHGGDPSDPNWETAHQGIIKDPTFPRAEKVCGECHDDLIPEAEKSLHYTLAGLKNAVLTRADKNPAVLAKVMEGYGRHCTQCHSSCGQCHVSRPDYVKGGFLAGHLFQKTPPMDTTCAGCHGGRVHGEYTGAKEGYQADIHYSEDMTCMDCHQADEMHAEASDAINRFDAPYRPKCEKCHEEVVSDKPKTESHAIHRNKLACQVCHSQAYKNCFSCHVGTDPKGLPYFKCKKTEMMFKIGLNVNKSQKSPFDFVVVRHPPADPALFDFYVKNGLTGFNGAPTWKTAAPHNIRRLTPQNKTCNQCHGQRELFLGDKDISEEEREANARVIVPADRAPGPIKKETGKD